MILAYIDGGARGNPGPAGYGARIESSDGTLIEELHGALGIATNNVAEYHGLLAALRWAIDHDVRDLRIRSDSELLVKQMRGEYKVKHPGLQPLAARARLLMMELGDVTFEHVRREANREADRLSNVAMDEAEKKGRRRKEEGKRQKDRKEPVVHPSSFILISALAGPHPPSLCLTRALMTPIIRPALSPAARNECRMSG